MSKLFLRFWNITLAVKKGRRDTSLYIYRDYTDFKNS